MSTDGWRDRQDEANNCFSQNVSPGLSSRGPLTKPSALPILLAGKWKLFFSTVRKHVAGSRCVASHSFLNLALDGRMWSASPSTQEPVCEKSLDPSWNRTPAHCVHSLVRTVYWPHYFSCYHQCTTNNIAIFTALLFIPAWLYVECYFSD